MQDMNYGFIKVAAAVPNVRVADCFYNIQEIEKMAREADEKGVQIIACLLYTSDAADE